MPKPIPHKLLAGPVPKSMKTIASVASVPKAGSIKVPLSTPRTPNVTFIQSGPVHNPTTGVNAAKFFTQHNIECLKAADVPDGVTFSVDEMPGFNAQCRRGVTRGADGKLVRTGDVHIVLSPDLLAKLKSGDVKAITILEHEVSHGGQKLVPDPNVSPGKYLFHCIAHEIGANNVHLSPEQKAALTKIANGEDPEYAQLAEAAGRGDSEAIGKLGGHIAKCGLPPIPIFDLIAQKDRHQSLKPGQADYAMAASVYKHLPRFGVDETFVTFFSRWGDSQAAFGRLTAENSLVKVKYRELISHLVKTARSNGYSREFVNTLRGYIALVESISTKTQKKGTVENDSFKDSSSEAKENFYRALNNTSTVHALCDQIDKFVSGLERVQSLNRERTKLIEELKRDISISGLDLEITNNPMEMQLYDLKNRHKFNKNPLVTYSRLYQSMEKIKEIETELTRSQTLPDNLKQAPFSTEYMREISNIK